MCGLAGIAPSSVDRLPEIKRLQLMGGTIAHRRPGDAGVYVTPGIGLASRRLSILDLSPSGHMPMVTRMVDTRSPTTARSTISGRSGRNTGGRNRLTTDP